MSAYQGFTVGSSIRAPVCYLDPLLVPIRRPIKFDQKMLPKIVKWLFLSFYARTILLVVLNTPFTDLAKNLLIFYFWQLVSNCPKICPLRVSQRRGSRYTDSPYIETLVSNDQFRDSNIVVVADRGSLFDCSLDPPTAVLFYVTAQA